MNRETQQSRDGPLAAAITTKVVKVFGDHTGRGPTRGRTFINENLVSCLLRDTLTKPERSLAAAGEVDTVLEGEGDSKPPCATTWSPRSRS